MLLNFCNITVFLQILFITLYPIFLLNILMCSSSARLRKKILFISTFYFLSYLVPEKKKGLIHISTICLLFLDKHLLLNKLGFGDANKI